MVNENPKKIDEDVLPEVDEPVDRDTVDNLLVGVYSTDEEGVWRQDIRDWSNRVVEATVYEKERSESEEKGGCSFFPLDTPEDMSDEAYLKELLRKRVEEVKSEIAEA